MRPPEGLVAESESWCRDGLISEEQRRAILARYDVDTGAAQASRILRWLALIVAGIGVVVLVAWNWTAIPPAVKIVGTVGPMIGLYAAAAAAARSGRRARTEGLAVAAALFTGAVLFVTDDLLHVDPARTSTLLLWSAVLAATAALSPSAVAAGVGSAVGAWWILVTAGAPPPPWWFLAVWPALAIAVERVPNRWAAGGVALVFGFWVFFAVLDVWNDQAAVPSIAAILAGNWLYTLSRAPAAGRPAFARTTPALVITLLGLAFLLPSGSHRGMTDWHLAADRVWPPLVLMAALAGATLWNVARLRAWRSRPAGLTMLSVLWLAAWFLLPGASRTNAALQWTWTAIFSGAMIHLGAAAVRDAARARDVGQFAVGIAAVLIFVAVRVVDARSLAVSGLMLVASAMLLLWLARLWVRPAGAPS
jgi:uncharacterized membrane protein